MSRHLASPLLAICLADQPDFPDSTPGSRERYLAEMTEVQKPLRGAAGG